MEKNEVIAKIEALEAQLLDVKGTECEVYSRIVGYFRPLKQWNSGKLEEFSQRETYDMAYSESAARVI